MFNLTAILGFIVLLRLCGSRAIAGVAPQSRDCKANNCLRALGQAACFSEATTKIISPKIVTPGFTSLPVTQKFQMIFNAREPTCQTPDPHSQTVFLRIEGAASTIFEGLITSGPSNITTQSGGTHTCNGLNNGANAIPGATCTSALNAAACENGFTWDGTFSEEFDDFYIIEIGGEEQTDSQFWGLLLNYKFTTVGGCQMETQDGDEVLWAWGAFDKGPFLQASTDREFRSREGEGTVGVRMLLYVRDGGSGELVEGAMIGGVVTDARGEAEVRFERAGTFEFKAEREGSIRSNAVTVVVSPAV